MSAPLSLTGVEKDWRGRRVLNGVDLELGRGEVLWLGGDNGAGKTTLLRIAAGVIRATAGRVAIEGREIAGHDPEAMARLGYLPAGSGGLYARLSVRENVRLAASLALIPRRQVRGRTDAALERAGIGELATRRADRLSLGQRQRVRLAVATVHDPDVLLLDEPASSLDEEGLAMLTRRIEAVTGGGGAVMWCSPGPEAGLLPADRRLRVRDGLVVPA